MRLLWSQDPIRTAYPLPHKDVSARKQASSGANQILTQMFVRDIHKTDFVDSMLTHGIALHTRESVADEIRLPSVLHQTIFVDFTPTESAVYEYVASIHPNNWAILSEACVHPNIQTANINLRVCNDLNEVLSAMTAGIRDELEALDLQAQGHQATVSHYQERLIDMGHAQFVQDVEQTGGREEGEIIELADDIGQGEDDMMDEVQQPRERINAFDARVQRRFVEEYRVLSTILDKSERLRRSLAYFENVTQIAPGENCLICLTSMEDPNIRLAWTACGHRFCGACVTAWTEAHGNCPVCRQRLTARDLLMLAPRSTVQTADTIYDEHRMRFGTKIATLLRHIDQHRDEKLVIFTQFESVLSKTARILKSLGIRYATCFGNLASREKGLRDFKNDVNLILISTHSSNVGLTLTQASEVIFLDPVSH